jgi:hypothetical protein
MLAGCFACDTLNVSPCDAKIGELAIGKGLQLGHSAAVALPSSDTGLKNFKHLFLLLFAKGSSFSLDNAYLGAVQQKENCKFCMASNT